MQQLKRYPKNILNTDDDFGVVNPAHHIFNENFRFGTTEAGATGRWEAFLGNIILSNQYLPSTGINERFAAFKSEANNVIIYMNWNSQGLHGIYAFIAGVWYKVLLDNQVTGGLLFSRDNIAYSGGIIGNLVYFTDNVNEPRRFNYVAGIKMNHNTFVTTEAAYTAPLAASVITLIRKPPIYPLAIQRTTTGVAASLTKDSAFRFFYNYVYRDGEVSTWSEHSVLDPYNYVTDTFDSVLLTMPLAETIQQDVQKIQFAVIYVAEGADVEELAFIINVFDKSNPTDAAAFIAHNTGTALTFSFSNSGVGQAIDGASKIKPYDAVPLLANAMEIAQYRLFLANSTLGYNTPTVTSLSASLTAASAPSLSTPRVFKSNSPYQLGVVFYDNYNRQSFVVTNKGLRLGTPTRNYGLTSVTTGVNWALSNTTATTEIPVWATSYDVVLSKNLKTNFFLESLASGIVYTKKDDSGLFILDGSLLTYSSDNYGIAIKASYLNSYGLGYVRQDGDICNLYINGGATYSLSVKDQTADWIILDLMDIGAVSGATNVLFEIYSPLKRTDSSQFFERSQRYAVANAGTNTRSYSTLSGTFNGDVYLQSRPAQNVLRYHTNVNNINATYHTIAAAFVSQDVADANYSTGSSTLNAENTFDVTTDNSRWIFQTFANPETIQIIGGITVLCSHDNYYYARITTNGNEDTMLTDKTFIPTNTSKKFYINQFISVPPNTKLFIRGVMTDGSAIYYQANDLEIRVTSNNVRYFTQAMSPNDKYWKNWFTDAGRLQVVSSVGQSVNNGAGHFSNVIVQGSQINGLSTFDGDDIFQLSRECGAIQKLVLTNKQQEQGNVMLAIGQFQTNSVYLGEQKISSSGATQFLAAAGSVIGTIDPLRGEYGTQNPESVIAYDGNVYWVDVRRSTPVQYSTNGLYAAANAKATRFWNGFCAQYRSMTPTQIRVLGNTPYLHSGFDSYNQEWLITVPRVLGTAPKGYLNDYGTTRFYPYDMYDGQGKTMSYKISNDPNSWQGAGSYVSEGFVSMGNNLFAFKSGQLWQFGTGFANFFGTQYKCRIALSINEEYGSVKVFRNISLEGCNVAPSFTHLRTEIPNVQSTDLVAADYVPLEGKLYADFLMDRLTPSATSFDNGQFFGDTMRSEYGLLFLEFDGQSNPTLKFINIGVEASLGHTT